MPRTLPNPVIVVPGITATYLRDDYPLPPETVWSVLTKGYERLALHPDNLKYEATQPARVSPDQIFEVAYKELVSELRHNLRQRPDQPVPVFPFGYDWRHPLEMIETQLAAFIDEVIERTSLLRHYDSDGYADEPQVNLVGHSMGGLVIAGCLERLGSSSQVGKVVTLATPFRGSFEAVIKVITGTADLGTSAPSSREREAARLTPALYYLMPSFKRGLDIQDGADLPGTLFESEIWQPSVVDTLTQFVQLRGLNRRAARTQAQELFATLLRIAQRHRRRVERFTLASAGLKPEDWLCVVGVNSRTRVRLKVVKRGGRPEFLLSGNDRTDEWTSPEAAGDARRFTGDGTVPYEGAVPGFLEERNLVCVTPGDFGYWEVGDRVMSQVAGFHGILPNMDMLHRMIVRHFTGRPDRHKNTWGRPAPGVTKQEWSPPLPLDAR